MNLRFYCVAALVALAGCGGSNAPIADMQLTAEEGVQDPGTASLDPSGTPDITDPSQTDPSIEDLAANLQQSAQGGNFKEALGFAKEALKLEPENHSLLAMASQLAQTQGAEILQSGGDRKAANTFFISSADFARRIQASGSPLSGPIAQFLGQIFYNEACAHATNGDNDKSLASLKEAFSSGFSDFALVDSDADLAELRETPEFKQAVTTFRLVHRTRVLAEVKEQFAGQKPFEFDFDLVSTNGKPVKLADYKGKVLIVDFWGTWCPPCRMEIPHFVELLSNHKSAGLEIVGINYERGEPSEFNDLINTFAKENGVTYPCLIGDEATQSRVPDFQGYPTTLFIDQSGKVRLQVVGYHPYEKLEAIIQTLLAESGESTGG